MFPCLCFEVCETPVLSFLSPSTRPSRGRLRVLCANRLGRHEVDIEDDALRRRRSLLLAFEKTSSCRKLSRTKYRNFLPFLPLVPKVFQKSSSSPPAGDSTCKKRPNDVFFLQPLRACRFLLLGTIFPPPLPRIFSVQPHLYTTVPRHLTLPSSVTLVDPF